MTALSVPLGVVPVTDAAGKPKTKTRLTDPERHKRFVKMAKEVGASEKPADFDRAFKAVTGKQKAP